jgi:hypothetical protein
MVSLGNSIDSQTSRARSAIKKKQTVRIIGKDSDVFPVFHVKEALNKSCTNFSLLFPLSVNGEEVKG